MPAFWFFWWNVQRFTGCLGKKRKALPVAMIRQWCRRVLWSNTEFWNENRSRFFIFESIAGGLVCRFFFLNCRTWISILDFLRGNWKIRQRDAMMASFAASESWVWLPCPLRRMDLKHQTDNILNPCRQHGIKFITEYLSGARTAKEAVVCRWTG